MSMTRRTFMQALAMGAGAAALAPRFALGEGGAYWAPFIRNPAVPIPSTPLTPAFGAIPPGLSGTLFRNGPGRLNRGGMDCGHWFDGDGCIVSVDVGAGGASAQVRYIETEEYLKEERAGRYLYPGYGTTLPGPAIKSSLGRIKNAANTSLMPLNGKILTLWEGGSPYAIDPETLETLGLEPMEHMDVGEPFSAHPKVHPVSGEIYNFGVLASSEVELRVHRMAPNGDLIARGSVIASMGSMVHDFAVAGPYVIFILPPIRLRPAAALLGRASLSECMEWMDDEGTEIIVLDRFTLEEVNRFVIDPLFFWHIGNMEVEGDEAHLTLVEMDDFHANTAWFTQIPGGSPTAEGGNIGYLSRLRLDLVRGRMLENSPIMSLAGEFPLLHPTDLASRRSETLIAINDRPRVEAHHQLNAIGRVDIESGNVDLWNAGEEAVVSEAIFAPDQLDSSVSWALVMTWEAEANQCFLDILRVDAIADGPVCRLPIPTEMFFSFHGAWVPRAI